MTTKHINICLNAELYSEVGSIQEQTVQERYFIVTFRNDIQTEIFTETQSILTSEQQCAYSPKSTKCILCFYFFTQNSVKNNFCISKGTHPIVELLKAHNNEIEIANKIPLLQIQPKHQTMMHI